MGSLLALDAGMRTIALLITLLAVAPQDVTDQKPVVPEGTIITSVEVTGFDIDRLSPGLRHEIRTTRRHSAQPTAPRRTRRAHRGRAAPLRRSRAQRHGLRRTGEGVLRHGPAGAARARPTSININERYIVEDADITGVSEEELTQALRDDLLALVGKRLDSGDADKLQERLTHDLPGYDVSRRIERGSEPGRIRLVYEARRREPRWLRFEPLRSNVIYQLRHWLGKLRRLQHR